jgi:ankyrin repeat protein
MSMNSKKFAVLARKYATHPEFLGIELTDPNQPGAVDDTLLHIAARTGAIDDIAILVSVGASVNAVGDLGNTPLHHAAMAGEVAAVKKLLALGADPRLENEFNQTPLQVAELGGYREIVAILAKRQT